MLLLFIPISSTLEQVQAKSRHIYKYITFKFICLVYMEVTQSKKIVTHLK